MIVEAVDPHLRNRQHVDRLGEGNGAAGVGVAGEQRLEAGLGELRLEVFGDFEDRRPGIGAICDADDAPLQPPRVGRLAVLEGGRLHPRRVKVLHHIAGDDAAAEAADARIIPRARHVAGLRVGCGRRESREERNEDKQCDVLAQKGHWHLFGWQKGEERSRKVSRRLGRQVLPANYPCAERSKL